MKAIYYNIFGLGHINPTLPIVKALQEKGIDVIYHSSPERKDLIESFGASFVNYGYDEYKASDFNPGANFVLQTIPATVGLLPFLKEEFERVRPDFILYDSMAIWGYVIGLIYNIPSFCTVTTFALSEKMKIETFNRHDVKIDEANLKAIDYLHEVYGIKLELHQALGAYEKHNIVFTSKNFNPIVDGQFYYSGAMIANRKNENNIYELRDIRKSKKIITMAFGTILLEQYPELIFLFEELIEAFGNNNDYQLVLALGTDQNLNKLGKLPENVIGHAKIPQIEVLKYTDLFISHAGMNSVNEALHFGVPILAIPHSHDQFGNAKRLVDLKLGRELNIENVSQDRFKELVPDILVDKELRSHLDLMKNDFQLCRGLDGILDYMNSSNLFGHKGRFS